MISFCAPNSVFTQGNFIIFQSILNTMQMEARRFHSTQLSVRGHIEMQIYENSPFGAHSMAAD